MINTLIWRFKLSRLVPPILQSSFFSLHSWEETWDSVSYCHHSLTPSSSYGEDHSLRIRLTEWKVFHIRLVLRFPEDDSLSVYAFSDLITFGVMTLRLFYVQILIRGSLGIYMPQQSPPIWIYK